MRQAASDGYYEEVREGQRIPFLAAYLSQGYSRVLDRGYALNFIEIRNDELRRIPIPRTPLHKGKR